MGSCTSSFSKSRSTHKTHDIRGVKSNNESSLEKLERNSRSRLEAATAAADTIVQSIIQSVLENNVNKDDVRIRSLNKKLNGHIDRILPTLRCLIMRNNQEDPYEIIKLKQIVKEEEFWLLIMLNLIDKIDIDDPLGPSLIAIFLEETPLPTKDQISQLMDKIQIDQKSYSEKIERNILIILSCLIQKVSGTPTAQVLIERNIEFTIRCLNYGNNEQNESKSSHKLSVLLFALIALEKFSTSSFLKKAESKSRIMSNLSSTTTTTKTNQLVLLAEWSSSNNDNDPLRHQIGFMAQFLLDNIYTPQNHVYGCFNVNENEINVRLNDEDASENLKISPNGLEARNDTLSFESVRSTLKVQSGGVWYYEVTLLTSGIMQIGFATKAANFFNHQGFGIGDDEYSVGYDGCRNLIWHRANYQAISGHEATWKEGDVIGFLLDLDQKRICFYHNGRQINPVHTEIFQSVSDGKGIYPAASFMTFQHVEFNFGHKEFKYAPVSYKFGKSPTSSGVVKSFNSAGVLSSEKRVVLPKKKKLELLKQMVIKEDACTLCYENASNTILTPCQHKNFCESCVQKLKTCPICRANILGFDLIDDHSTKSID